MRAVETQGVGLHSGVPVKLRLTPAPAATGIVFRRTDLDNFEIPASWRYVQKVSYATSLMRQGVLISTTEHLLSTFYSMGIDNAYVEIDNLEVPILDGSGLPFVEMICGRRASGSRAAASALSADPPTGFGRGRRQADHDSTRRRFLLTCDVFFPHPLVGRRSWKWRSRRKVRGGNGPARTFGFEYELSRCATWD